jgi:hypothetical protein
MNCVTLFRAIPIHQRANVSLKYLDIARLRLSPSYLEITDYIGRVQRFHIVWIPTYFGRHRAINRPLLGRVGATRPAQTRFRSGWCLSLNLGGLVVGYFDCEPEDVRFRRRLLPFLWQPFRASRHLVWLWGPAPLGYCT